MSIEDFTVVCDETNNSKETLEQGYLIADIYVPQYVIKCNFTVDKNGKVKFEEKGE